MLRAVGPHHLHLVALGGGPVAAAEVEFVLRELRLSAASDGARAGSASWPSGTRSAAVVVLPIPSKKFSDSPGMCVAKVRELLLDRAAPAALRARWASATSAASRTRSDGCTRSRRAREATRVHDVAAAISTHVLFTR